MSTVVKEKTAVEHLQELMREVAENRDRNAFSSLFDHYAPLIRAYALAREPGAVLVADEIAQEVMIRVWLKAHTFNATKANINTWIFTLARNCRIDYLRRNGRYASEVDADALFAGLEAEGADPFEATQQKLAAERIRERLNTLPTEQRQVLDSIYLEGKTQQETSEEMRIPLGTVKSRVRLALQKLQISMRGDQP